MNLIKSSSIFHTAHGKLKRNHSCQSKLSRGRASPLHLRRSHHFLGNSQPSVEESDVILVFPLLVLRCPAASLTITPLHGELEGLWRASFTPIILHGPRRACMAQCTRRGQEEEMEYSKCENKKSPLTRLNGGRINILEVEHYANGLWFRGGGAGKLDDVL